MKKLSLITMFVFYLFSLTECQAKLVSQEQKYVENKNDTINHKEKKLNEVNLLMGKWFTPHNADKNIIFYKNGTFVLNDYNVKKDKDEVLKGTFELSGNKLILKYYGKPQQTFNFEKKTGTYYITKGKDYYFVKSSLESWVNSADESDSVISR